MIHKERLMRSGTAARRLFVSFLLTAALASSPCEGAVPPGRQHLLTIEGENTVTFVPQAGLEPFKIDYKARVEYIVNTRTRDEAIAKGEGASKKQAARKAVAAARTRRKDGEGPAAKVAGSVDLAVHSSEMKVRQNGQVVLESRMSRSRFEGRLQPDQPVTSVSTSAAPPRLQEFLRTFDTTTASLLIDDDSKVVDRKIRTDGPLRALTETLLSIHTPIPRDVAFWEAPTQLAMGQGQTARGTLRFEKDMESVARTGGLVKVTVSGVLKAEGVVVGKLIKDGRYTVTGEQSYDPSSREWKSSRWTVAVDNELANPGGQTVAHAQGTMLVQSKALDDSPSPAASASADRESPGAKP
jgi:hypothetical protein